MADLRGRELDGNGRKDSLEGKIAVVTGATAGIGLYTALGLAERGAQLVITGRDAKRLADAAAWIKSRVPDARIETEQGDFASLRQVRALAERIVARHPRIQILVNNAGLIATKWALTEDGFESTFQVNHLAPFLLTNMLLPALKAGAPARIVTVSSRASSSGRIAFDNPNLSKGLSFWAAYGQSKLANIMMTYALARRLDGTGVTATALHPGFVASNFGNKGPLANFAWKLLRPLQIAPEEGARKAIHAAAAAEMEGVTGQYLVETKPARSNPISYDTDAVERLWRESAQMTGITA
jgi:retinol dehydrogenase-14